MTQQANIVLAGFMGSGKSTVGNALSRLSGMPFIDVDEVIESSRGMSIRDIFESGGEKEFRRLEKDAIRDESAVGGRVIAVGGGAVLDSENVRELKSRGIIYLLRVSAEDVRTRVGNDAGRPLLSDNLDGIAELLQSREQRYLAAADVVVDTGGKEPMSLVENIYSDYRRRTAG